jgi:hypothetical protein
VEQTCCASNLAVLLTTLRGIDQRARCQEQQPQGCGSSASRS